MSLRACCLCWSLLLASCAAAPVAPSPSAGPSEAAVPGAPVGYEARQLYDASRECPVWVDLWYPAVPSARPESIRYGLATGLVARNASALDGPPRTLLVLSHGTGGSAADYAWLAEYLASRGYVVAGVNHFGDSRAYGPSTVNRLASLRSWTRPMDLHFAIASLLADPSWGARLRSDRIGGLGHSAGGHALLALAGATYDPMRLATYCRSNAGRANRGCSYAQGLTVEQWMAVGRPPAGPLPSGPRLAALFLMEPAMGASFEAEDLQKVTAATQVVAANPGDFLPFADAERLVSLLPQGTMESLGGGAGHFVFLSECEFEVEVQGLALCRDARGVERRAVHRQLTQLAEDFFARSLR